MEIVITVCGWSSMSYELLISFDPSSPSEQVQVKQHVLRWLELKGRGDYVEGIIDGVDIKLTETEEDTALTTDERLATSSVAIFDATEEDLKNLADQLIVEFGGAVRTVLTELVDESWQSSWRDDFAPLETGQFHIVPRGDACQTPGDLTRVVIDAGDGAFGTGQHTTTRAIIRVMEENFSEWRPESLLDVGTGTGIYLILAGKMGIRVLSGTEISEDLVALARSNCKEAEVAATIELCERPRFHRMFDVVIANILVPVLHDLMADLREHLSPKGRLIVAGFVEKEQHPLVKAAESHGLVLESSSDELGWKCLVFRIKQATAEL